MFGKPKAWRTPGGDVYRLFQDMAIQPHLLIAGATGSGKSVLENGIITTILHHSPAKVELILLDPKRVELLEYKRLPHVLRYASEPGDTVEALHLALQIVEKRYCEMQRTGIREYQGGHVYVIIDELAALMTTQKRTVLPMLQQLGQIARAARVHMIACTQTVKADVLPTVLTCNFDSRVALRTSTAQQSRMIVDRPGCESFPAPRTAGTAFCLYRRGADIDRCQIPTYRPEYTQHIISWWTSRQCVA